MSNHPGLNEFLVRLHGEYNTSLPKFIIAKLSIRKLGSSSVLIIINQLIRIESFAINLRSVSRKLN